MSNASKYVVGLLFSPDSQNVALIQKDHPEWQAGKYNGLGGHVEPGETVEQAVSREVEEEGGVHVPPEEWEMFLVLEGDSYSVTFLRAFSPDVLLVQSTTSEPVSILATSHINHLKTIANLKWIVPLAMDQDLAVPVHVFDKNIAGKRTAA